MLGAIFSAAVIGLLASGGPCTAARVISGSAFYRKEPRGIALAAFTFGAFLTDVALVSSFALFLHALALSDWCYAAAAIAFLCTGLWTMFRRPAHRCALASRPNAPKGAPLLALPLAAGIGSALLLGACCAPFVLAAAATAGSSWNPIAIAVAYASAHAGVPLVCSLLSRRLERILLRAGAQEAMIAIEAGLFIACALYFGALA